MKTFSAKSDIERRRVIVYAHFFVSSRKRSEFAFPLILVFLISSLMFWAGHPSLIAQQIFSSIFVVGIGIITGIFQIYFLRGRLDEHADEFFKPAFTWFLSAEGYGIPDLLMRAKYSLELAQAQGMILNSFSRLAICVLLNAIHVAVLRIAAGWETHLDLLLLISFAFGVISDSISVLLVHLHNIFRAMDNVRKNLFIPEILISYHFLEEERKFVMKNYGDLL